MKPVFSFLFLLALATGFAIFLDYPQSTRDAEQYPEDLFFRQRAYPSGTINYNAYREALSQAAQKMAGYGNQANRQMWEPAGPENIGGRFSDIEGHPALPGVLFAASSSGGIYKTTDNGVTWTPVFDDALSLSLGDIAIAPSNPSVIYAGTGEANAGGGSITYDGFGIYRSDDTGETWQHVGLDNVGSVGRMAVHPQNPDVVFVAAMGRMFSKTQDRGIYRSMDGGISWENVLFVSDSTGAVDICINPLQPDTLYCAMWERIRTPSRRSYGGVTSNIYRSFDGGDTWEKLTSGLPANSPNGGRIGISISPSQPDILYAIYADQTGYFNGVYKTVNSGNTWTRVNDGALSNCYASYGWWFGRIQVDPVNPNIAYVIGFDLYKTTSGGNSWSMISSTVHVDHHGLYIDPSNNNKLALGCDGGVYLSQNGGSSWIHLENLPNIQFYTCEIDYQYPQRLYGGAQDNGTLRTMTGNTDDWTMIFGGDGFRVLVDPANNNYVYCEYQYGQFQRSTNGGNSFGYAMNGINSGDRFNWNTPVVFDPSNPSVLYLGSNKVYKTTNRASSWQVISPDLTGGQPGNLVYGTIYSISVSPVNPGVIYAGTDDGRVWVTVNGGSNWQNVSAGLPQRWVTSVAADPFDVNKVYVTFSGYKFDSYIPHIMVSHNKGFSWEDISADLPQAPVNIIIPDPLNDSALYVGSDVGVYVSWNDGENWGLLGDGLPNVPVLDLKLHAPTHTLVAATYGRSMYKIQLNGLVNLSGPDDNSDFSIYPNPVTDMLIIENRSLNKSLGFQIVNSSGKICKSGLLQNITYNTLIINEFPKGYYVIKVFDGSKERSFKILKM